MWTYQPHFRTAQQAAARRVFQSLDEQFSPEFLLVGFLARPARGLPPVCIEPADDFWLTSRDFADCSLLTEKGFAQLPGGDEEEAADSPPPLQRERTLRKTIRDAVASVVAKHAGWPSSLRYWVALPARVGNYWVCPAIGLQSETLQSHPALKTADIRIPGGRRMRVATSLIDAVTIEYLERITLELMRPQPGRELSGIEPEEVLRAAGRRLMTGVVWRIDESSVEGMPDLFRTFNTVSSLNYERAAGSGSIFVSRRGHPALKAQVEFSSSARMRHHGHARKLLELTSSELGLHSDSDRIFGLVEVDRSRLAGEDIFEARVFGHHHWELMHNGRPLMRVQYGQPTLPGARIDASKLRIDLQRLFEGISSEDCDLMVALVEEAVDESHGTILVISADARTEAARLSAQCIPLKPRKMTAAILRHLTPIDGAVLLSPDGMCHAIGTILDGIASANGDPSRGARYNSAVRYVESTSAPCLAVVVSEDGRVDYVPDLRPPIDRDEIETRLAALEAMHRHGRVSRRAYSEVLAWFDGNRFYLLAEHCGRLNDLIGSIESRLEASDPHLLTMVRSPYIPHPQMDARLYYTKPADQGDTVASLHAVV
jgi:hypothetical protein